MKQSWFYILIIFILFSCETNTKKNTLTNFIPDNATSVFKFSNLTNLKNNLNNNSLLKDFITEDISEKLTYLDSIKSNSQTVFCVLPNNKFVTISEFKGILSKDDSLKISKLPLYVLEENFLISASNKNTLKTALDEKLSDKNSFLLKGNKATSFQLNNDNFLKAFFLNDTLQNFKLTERTFLDAEISQNNIQLNGITKATDSTKSLINVFKKTIPQENKTASITPSNADGFLSFTFDHFEEIRKNLNAFNQDSTTVKTALFDFITEVGVIYEGNNRAIVLNSIDETETFEVLNSASKKSDFRQVAIYNFEDDTIFSKSFFPLVTFNNATQFCQLDNFFVFSNSTETLENIIVNYQNKTTLSERSNYKSLEENLNDEASLLLVSNTKNLVSNFKNLANLNLTDSNFKHVALQFVYENNFAHTNIALSKNGSKSKRESGISENFNIKLEADLLNNPQFVKNHKTGANEIVVQDINNQLYLISNSGTILWKKALNNPILGDITQIDMYKNGRLQLTFATKNRVYILDRNGKDVKPFPLKFNDAITQPLSVFDYDKKKKYRLFVTQDKNILVYDAKGKKVKGFTFKKAENTINAQPQHFRIGSKDYIVIKTDNNIDILNRTGKTRVSPKNKYNYSNKPVFVYNNKFTTTSNNGKLISIDAKGNTASQDIGLNENYNIDTTNKTLVSISDNKLTIRDKSIDLDFGDYTTPEIFILNKRLYITVTDKQSQKVFVYNSQGELQPNFPIYATSQVDFATSKNGLELVTKSESNSVILYEVN